MLKFDLKKQYVLENERVLLRPLSMDDYQYLETFALNEPDLWHYSLMQAGSPSLMKQYMEKAINARQLGTEYPFIVFDKKSGTYAGSTRFYDINLTHNYLQLGFTWYGKQFWGTGLNKNCKFLMLAFAFEQIGIDRVEFRADAENARSIAAMKSIGCTVEGILRKNYQKPDGTRRDSIILSILKEEWHEGVKEALVQKLN